MAKKGFIYLLICVLICCMAAAACTACAGGSSYGDAAGNEEQLREDPAEQTEDSTSVSDTDSAVSDSESDSEAAGSGGDGIDVDLTTLSSTMIYSEVSDMMTSPQNYMGKKVKMNGAFAVYHDENTDKYYYACIIKDATACCSQGIEFELKGSHKYPDDYPEEGSDITVEGTFDTYSEGENTYCTLRDAVMA